MAPKSWASDEQWNWLIDRGVGWREAQKTNQTTPWFNGMAMDWLHEYCEADAHWGKDNWQRPFTLEQAQEYAAAVEARKVQLKTWFHNHGHKTTRRGGPKKVANSVKVPRAKNTRALQEIEIYSKRYYKSKVKAKVKAELKRLKIERNEPKLDSDVRLEVVRRFTLDSYEREPPEVRAEISAAAAEDKERCRALAEALKKEVIDVDAERTPEEYQHAIDQAPADIRRLLNPVHYSTGCAITVIVTGPMPEDGGAIGSFAVHFGENELGHNFAQVTPNFREIYARPHVHFAKGIYSEDKRQGRALPPSVTGIVPPSVVSRRSPSPGGVGSASSSPSASPPSSPEPSAQELPITSSEVATPLFILEERAKKPAERPGHTRGSRKAQPVIPSVLGVVPAVSETVSLMAQSSASVAAAGWDGSSWSGVPSYGASGGTMVWNMPWMNGGMHGGGLDGGMMNGGGMNGGMMNGGMINGGGFNSGDMNSGMNMAFANTMSGFPLFNPAVPSFGAPSTGGGGFYDELMTPLELPVPEEFPDNAAGPGEFIPDPLAGGTNSSTPFTSASSPPSSPAPSEPELQSGPINLPSDGAPGTDAPEAETRSTRAGRAVKPPKRKDATYETKPKRRKVTS
ncbi:hypothetical protein C8T65DRAFT_739059 [Cerioporus squamosus]|nr:hypothetical protein C8T65DRAFT_739059 [Cerioporus squamosus]